MDAESGQRTYRKSVGNSEDQYRRRQTGMHLMRSVETQHSANLLYDAATYRRYEYAPVADTVKKHLEMLNLRRSIPLHSVKETLDIGTATCRYPRFFARLGIRGYGIDLSCAGYRHIRSTGDKFSLFAQADGLKLPFRRESFDLVTCMMGTLNHLLPEQRVAIFEDVWRVLRPGGHLILGVWDGDCSFQNYLTLYGPNARQRFTAQPVTRFQLEKIASAVGYMSTRHIGFFHLADQELPALNIDDAGPENLMILDELDHIVRTDRRADHGQMFVATFRKS